ncbi:hypothetical protein HBA54_14285 [Pelagibius litoralis]|uniref:Uncharacterized protein n=1 Tax=Pelagibius litoralis TaxID=374515 RepID=A0A967EYH2_9PROT|nr:hypothetical protein [Pelagibius litoralis]NIA69768.1 hypothetical protein [Pelagibius litoralis]
MLNSLIAATLLTAAASLPGFAADAEVSNCFDDAGSWLPGTLQIFDAGQIHGAAGTAGPAEALQPMKRQPAVPECALV